MTARPCDPVGAVEIAQRLGVKRRTVDQWRQRALAFPEPRWLVGGRPAWNWDDIETWSLSRAGVYASSSRPASGLRQPPRGPAPGARPVNP